MPRMQVRYSSPESAHWRESHNSNRWCVGCRWGQIKDFIERIYVWVCDCGFKSAFQTPRCPGCGSDNRVLKVVEQQPSRKIVSLFLRCQRLGIWTWKDFSCDYFKSRRRR